MQPNTHQFYSFIDGKLSEAGRQSLAFKAVLHLFETAGAMYNALAQETSEQLSIFVDSGRYLTPIQEHDLVALTARYVALLNSGHIRTIILQDQNLSEDDRVVLKAALDLYGTTAQASCLALGNPHWIEPGSK